MRSLARDWNYVERDLYNYWQDYRPLLQLPNDAEKLAECIADVDEVYQWCRDNKLQKFSVVPPYHLKRVRVHFENFCKMTGSDVTLRAPAYDEAKVEDKKEKKLEDDEPSNVQQTGESSNAGAQTTRRAEKELNALYSHLMIVIHDYIFKNGHSVETLLRAAVSKRSEVGTAESISVTDENVVMKTRTMRFLRMLETVFVFLPSAFIEAYHRNVGTYNTRWEEVDVIFSRVLPECDIHKQVGSHDKENNLLSKRMQKLRRLIRLVRNTEAVLFQDVIFKLDCNMPTIRTPGNKFNLDSAQRANFEKIFQFLNDCRLDFHLFVRDLKDKDKASINATMSEGSLWF